MACDAIYCFDRGSVLFALRPEGSEGPRIVGEIAEDALRDVFGARGGGDSLVEACRDNFAQIEKVALLRYRRNPAKPALLATSDFEFPFYLEADPAA